MSLRPVAYVGAVAPEGVAVTVGQGESGIDLTTATAASMLVKLPDGTETTWTAVLSGATSLSVVATHTFAAGDLTQRGRYVVVVALTVPGGTIRTRPKILTVLSQYAVDDPVVGG